MPAAPVVVVIESETELGRVIRDVLTDEGYEVVRVHDPFGAIGVMRQQNVDLVMAGLPAPSPTSAGPLNELVEQFPDVALVAVGDPEGEEAPFFGAWRRSGDRITLRQPYRLNDVIDAVRELVD